MSSVGDPVAFTFLSVTSLATDYCSGASPTVELASPSTSESAWSTLGLPVVDLGTREEDVRSLQMWSCRYRPVVPLRVVEVHNGLHGLSANLQRPLVDGVPSCLGVHGELFTVEEGVDDAPVEPVVHAKDC